MHVHNKVHCGHSHLFAGVKHCLIWERRPTVLSIRHCMAVAAIGGLGVLRDMQYWKVIVLCGLTVGTSFTGCRPQIDKQLNPPFNTTGSEIHMEIPVTVVFVGWFLILRTTAYQVSENLESLLFVTANSPPVHQMGCPAIRRVGSSPTLRDKDLG